MQDYHFSLLGRMLAERRPDLRTVHFLHTPFAAPAMLAVLPDDVAAELLDGMAGYGACGFHCHKWEAGFAACYAAAGPAGAADVRRAARPRRRRAGRGGGVAPSARRRPTRCAAEVGGRRIVARTDRMEPSKNIVRGMLAFEELLTAHPEWRGQVVHVAFAYPSRQGLAEYLAYAADVEHTAERINHAFGVGVRRAGRPIVLSLEDDRARSLAALTLSDVLLVNPVRDGLNLVAKEGPLLNRDDGVLVLSHEAGAWEELELAGGGALGVNPFDVTGTAEALHAALSMERAGARRRGRPRCAPACAADVRRLVGRPAGGRSGLSASRPRRGGVGQGAQERDRAGGAGHGEVGLLGHLGRALGVDGGDPHRVSGRPSGTRAPRPRRRRAGRRCRRRRPPPQRPGARPARPPGRAPPCPCRPRAAGAARARGGPGAPAGRARRLALGEGDDPVPVLGGTAPVQGDGQALGLDVDARRAPSAVASATTSSMTEAQASCSGPRSARSSP